MVSFAAEPIIRLGFFSVTNSFLDTLFVDGLLIGLIIIINKKISLIPNTLQNLIEMMLETFYSLTESVANERAGKDIPLCDEFLFVYFNR